MFLTSIKRWVVTRVVTGCFNGKRSGLKRLIKVSRFFPLTVPMARFFKSLEYGQDHPGEPFTELFLRLGSELSPQFRRKLASNLIFNQFITGVRRREALSTNGNKVPAFFVVSPTMKCNLSCRGCYAGLYAKDEVLPVQEMDRLFKEARDLGIYFVTISGGEPWLLRDELLGLFRKYSDMFFLTYTNGTLLDRGTCHEIARVGNAAPAISVEGFQKETEERRGRKTWPKILEAMENLRREGALFGFSATANSRNIDVLTSPEFVTFFQERGCMFGWYFQFLPVGKDPVLELVPTAEQRVEMGKRIAALRQRVPMFLADFWNDGPAAGGCLAGGRHYLHILNNGSVEPCVFAHFSSDSIKGKTLFQVANSPFFKAIRGSFPFNETGNLKRPCMIVDNPEVLRTLVKEHVIPSGHQSADSIINDPKVVTWVDGYARRMEELTEDEWEKTVSDPASRWYREGSEYRDCLRPPILHKG